MTIAIHVSVPHADVARVTLLSHADDADIPISRAMFACRRIVCLFVCCGSIAFVCICLFFCFCICVNALHSDLATGSSLQQTTGSISQSKSHSINNSLIHSFIQSSPHYTSPYITIYQARISTLIVI